MPKRLQRFFSHRSGVEFDSHPRALDPFSFAPAEYRIAKRRWQQKELYQLRGRTREFDLCSGLGDVNQLTFAAPRPVYRHHPGVERSLKPNAWRALTALFGDHHWPLGDTRPWGDNCPKIKARPAGKRVALRECFAHGDKSPANWPRTAFWLAFHGFVKPEALDREANRRYPITLAGEAAQSRIAVKV